MSKVSVTGSKAVMDDVIEAVYGLHRVHLSDYDGRWPDFDRGDPMAGAEGASEKLVTVRALKNTLGVTEDDAGPSRIVTDETLEDELEEVRTEANELDDRRDEIEDELRAVDEQVDAMEPFAALGIDLDLLWGYDSLSVAVGEGDPGSVETVLGDLDAATETFSADGVVAAFAATDGETLDQALVEATFTAVEVPEEEGDPEEYLAELEHRRQRLESKLATVENQIEELRYDTAGFLLAAEEKLSIEVQKAEAPLSFATTKNAFVAEGWIPSERVTELERAVEDAVGDHAEVEELEVAEYSRHGHAETSEEVHDGAEDGDVGAAAAAAAGAASDGANGGADSGEVAETEPAEREAAPDGGVVTMRDEDPPVIQDNPGPVKPFELLTEAVGRPNYSELDPTLVLFLTVPAFFGFMIADVGYGAVYMAIGYFLYRNYDSAAFESIGLVTVAAGFFTALFGFFFGEIFGLHLITTHFWEPVAGGVPLHKGLTPNHSRWALGWFLIIALVGVLHLNVGYLFEFIEGYTLHGLKEAVIESGSWLLALNGLWLFILSTYMRGPKPDFLFEVFNRDTEHAQAAIELGFSGLPEIVGIAGLAMVGAGFVLLAIGPTYELVEFHVILAHPLSYLRIGAELLAEVGLAFAVNLLFWGGYATEGEHGAAWHFGIGGMPQETGVEYHHEVVSDILFPGLVHMGPAFAVLGVFVLLAGTFIVLALGVMSVAIQAIRLEYFEFFAKFYEGNGTTYSP
ncbi:MAG: V-type ATP synthase subunit I, partial [Haloarculaceae archaeon]